MGDEGGFISLCDNIGVCVFSCCIKTTILARTLKPLKIMSIIVVLIRYVEPWNWIQQLYGIGLT